MKDPQRGEVWWGEIAEVGRRPFLVMSRAAVIPLLKSVIAVAITRIGGRQQASASRLVTLLAERGIVAVPLPLVVDTGLRATR